MSRCCGAGRSSTGPARQAWPATWPSATAASSASAATCPATRRSTPTGCVVAPGFIDIHTHYDAQVFWDPALTPSCFHGVTTVVAGNCGFSIAPTDARATATLIARTLEKVEDMDPASLAAGIPWDFETFPEYLASVERHGTALNFAAYIGHTPLRIYVMGDEASEPHGHARRGRRRWPASSREAMDAGAAGFATSFAITHLGADGQPIPSRWADRAELEALFRAVGRRRPRRRRHQRRQRRAALRRDLRPAARARRARSRGPRC